jgi:hypothetical protein
MIIEVDHELELLLSLDGVSFETAGGYIVEFSTSRTAVTTARPHGISYALVFRHKAGGAPLIRFDNAHPVPHRGARFAKRPPGFDHWHRTEDDPGRPYEFTTAAQLLDDFWSEVGRIMNEKGIPHDL